MNIRRLALILLLLAGPPAIQSQQVEQTQPKEALMEDYRVGPGDSLSIVVFDASQFDQTIRISNSGKIHVPFLGILRVSDMTPVEIQSEIAGRLKERDLVKDPYVQVNVSEHRAHPVYILGEVMQPGQYLIRNDMNMIDLISLSSGFAETASPIGYLYRRIINNSENLDKNASTGSVPEEAIEINFQPLFDGTRPELNMKLRGGDVLYVPQRSMDYIFVVGDVVGSGAVEIPFGEKMLATQAIAKAGGPTRTSKLSKGMLMRYDNEGKRQELAVDFKAILNGKKPDIPLVAEDIIFIPGSQAKSVAYGLLNILPGIAQTAAP